MTFRAMNREESRLHRGFTAEWREGLGPYLWVVCTCGKELASVLRPVTAGEKYEEHCDEIMSSELA
jgi:hypothetical protein